MIQWLKALLIALVATAVGAGSAAASPIAGTHYDAATYAYIQTSMPALNHSAMTQRRGPPSRPAAAPLGTSHGRFATGVAANTATHAVPIGPGSEKAWMVLNRVDAKGAPLPGYKGGSVFKNTEGKLPETPGVTYREWNVNPYTKGVNRGSERVATGSDGSSYWTGDHYDTFVMFRGPTG